MVFGNIGHSRKKRDVYEVRAGWNGVDIHDVINSFGVFGSETDSTLSAKQVTANRVTP